MSSCVMKNQDSDEEVDLEALRLAALKSRKPKYPCINHNNLIPIVPVAVETKDFVNTKIKLEKVSPSRGDDIKDVRASKEIEEEKVSNGSKISLENDQDILSMDDKEEEDSLERLMDQLEAEISGQAPVSTNRSVFSSKTSSNNKKESKTSRKNEKDGDDEVELVQVKTGKEPSAIIEIRESLSPELAPKETIMRKSTSPRALRDAAWRSRSKLRSRSPFLRERSYRRSRSPYWSRSYRRSRSPLRRSRSPYWLSRKSRSKSRSPFSRRYRSPFRKRSPFSRFSRSRSTSYGRRSPWSLSPRRRSKSPFYHEGIPPRHRAFNSPRRSFSPRRISKSPRPFTRSPLYRRSKSPFRRSRSPFRRTSVRRSESPFLHRSKSPHSKLNSPNRSPIGKKYSKSPLRRSSPKSIDKLSPRHRSKSPGRRYEPFRRSPGRSKEGRSVSISTSPTPRRNRSPLKVVEKNKLGDEKNEKLRDRNRSERRHKSLSRENNRTHDHRSNRHKYFGKFSPSRNKRSADGQNRRSKSPKRKDTSEKGKDEISKPKEKEASPGPIAPLDPILEARKKKFENLGEVDPTVDKKINLKSIKESTENPEEDEDVLTLNLDCNLWDESEESEDEFESRFKSDGARKNRVGASNRTVLSFRNLREGDATNRKVNLSKPLTDDSRLDKFKRDRSEPWMQGKGRDRNDRRRKPRSEDVSDRNEEKDSGRSKPSDKSISQGSSARGDRRSDRRPIVWSAKNERKLETEGKDNEESVKHCEVKEKGKFSERTFNEGREKLRREDSDMRDADDFDKLISDFEKELESDLCVTTKEISSTITTPKAEVKRPKIKKDFLESTVEPSVKKPLPRIVKISEASLNKVDKTFESANNTNKLLEENKKVELNESQQSNEGPEDYIEDDDFVLEVSAARKQRSKGEEEDSQSDLRAVLSKRRNERLTKAVSLQENMPTRLVQSAFQGLRNKKSSKQIKEAQESKEFPLLDKTTGAEGRRVLLLHREKNPIPSIKCTVPEVKPDTTIHQRFTGPRRKRKLHRQLESAEDLDQEEEEQDGLEVEEEKQFRRFRLKRNVTLSSQETCYSFTEDLLHPDNLAVMIPKRSGGAEEPVSATKISTPEAWKKL